MLENERHIWLFLKGLPKSREVSLFLLHVSREWVWERGSNSDLGCIKIRLQRRAAKTQRKEGGRWLWCRMCQFAFSGLVCVSLHVLEHVEVNTHRSEGAAPRPDHNWMITEPCAIIITTKLIHRHTGYVREPHDCAQGHGSDICSTPPPSNHTLAPKQGVAGLSRSEWFHQPLMWMCSGNPVFNLISW